MRVPSYWNRPSWQRFFAGVGIGALIGWLMFLVIFGQMQEKQAKELITSQEKVKDLEKRIEILNQDKIELNKKNEQLLTLQEISVEFTNADKWKFDSLKAHTLREEVKDELHDLINKDIETINKSRNLIIKAIENKSFKIDNQTYKLKVYQLYLFTRLELELEIKRG